MPRASTPGRVRRVVLTAGSGALVAVAAALLTVGLVADDGSRWFYGAIGAGTAAAAALAGLGRSTPPA